MTDQELLQAISGIIDKKLDEKFSSSLEPIKTDIAGIKDGMSEIKTDITGLKDDVTEIKDTLTEVDDSIEIITEWIEKVADKERIPFLEIKNG